MGPELAKSTEEILSATKLAGIMWNHAPEMWHRMGEERAASFHIEPEEMANLFNFLYFIRFMEQPGDVQRGKDCFLKRTVTSAIPFMGWGEKQVRIYPDGGILPIPSFGHS